MRFNKIIYSNKWSLYSFIMILLVFTSCEEATVETNTTNASFEDFESLVQGRLPALYATLRSEALYQQSGLLGTWGEAGVDTHSGTIQPAEYVPIYTYSYNEGSLIIEQTWSQFYWAIKQINVFLGQANSLGSAGENENFNSSIAEAKFLRALLYFQLVKIWGNVPLLLEEGIDLDTVRKESEVANSEAEEVYLQIIDDLKFAENFAPEFTESDFRDIASKQAASALLGKVYLQMITSTEDGGVEGGIDENGNAVTVEQRLREARAQFLKIVDSGSFSLEEKYSDVFDVSNEGSNTETIFAIGFTGPNQDVGGDYGDFLGPIGNNQDGGAFGFFRCNLDFALDYTSFDGLVSVDSADLANNNVSPTLTDSASELFGAFPVDQTRPDGNLLAAGTPDFWANVESFNFRVEQLGAEKFVTDLRFEQNIARLNASALGNILRGDREPTPEENLNLNNVALTSWSPYKFIKPLPNPNEAGDGLIDFPLLRYGDIILCLAETENLLGNSGRAIDLMNLIRQRAFRENILTLEVLNPATAGITQYIEPTPELEGTSATDIATAIENGYAFSAKYSDERRARFLHTATELPDQTAISDAILEERLKELCYEGKRKDDLLRFGKLDDAIQNLHENSVNRTVGNQGTVKANFNLTRHSHWPIPLRELQLNPSLKQNCAYSSSESGCFN